MFEKPRPPEQNKKENKEQRLIRVRHNAEMAAKLEAERQHEASQLGLPENAPWEQILQVLSDSKEGLEPREGLPVSEENNVLPDTKAVDQETKGSLADSMRAFAHRIEERASSLSEIIENSPKNPGLDMAMHLAGGWEWVKRDLTKIAIKINYNIDESPDMVDQELLYGSIGNNWPYFERTFQATQRLEAYIEPLLDDNEQGTSPIRAFITSLRETTVDFNETFRPYGFEIDKVEILSPAPGNAQLDFAEGFLIAGRGSILPLEQMRALITRAQDKTLAPIVTDIKEFGFSISGERKSQTEVVVYKPDNWSAAIGGAIDACDNGVPKFRTTD